MDGRQGSADLVLLVGKLRHKWKHECWGIDALFCHAGWRTDLEAESLTFFSSSLPAITYQMHLNFELERVGGKVEAHSVQEVDSSSFNTYLLSICNVLGTGLGIVFLGCGNTDMASKVLRTFRKIYLCPKKNKIFIYQNRLIKWDSYKILICQIHAPCPKQSFNRMWG